MKGGGTVGEALAAEVIHDGAAALTRLSKRVLVKPVDYARPVGPLSADWSIRGKGGKTKRRWARTHPPLVKLNPGNMNWDRDWHPCSEP